MTKKRRSVWSKRNKSKALQAVAIWSVVGGLLYYGWRKNHPAQK